MEGALLVAPPGEVPAPGRCVEAAAVAAEALDCAAAVAAAAAVRLPWLRTSRYPPGCAGS